MPKSSTPKKETPGSAKKVVAPADVEVTAVIPPCLSLGRAVLTEEIRGFRQYDCLCGKPESLSHIAQCKAQQADTAVAMAIQQLVAWKLNTMRDAGLLTLPEEDWPALDLSLCLPPEQLLMYGSTGKTKDQRAAVIADFVKDEESRWLRGKMTHRTAFIRQVLVGSAVRETVLPSSVENAAPKATGKDQPIRIDLGWKPSVAYVVEALKAQYALAGKPFDLLSCPELPPWREFAGAVHVKDGVRHVSTRLVKYYLRIDPDIVVETPDNKGVLDKLKEDLEEEEAGLEEAQRTWKELEDREALQDAEESDDDLDYEECPVKTSGSEDGSEAHDRLEVGATDGADEGDDDEEEEGDDASVNESEEGSKDDPSGPGSDEGSEVSPAKVGTKRATSRAAPRASPSKKAKKQVQRARKGGKPGKGKGSKSS